MSLKMTQGSGRPKAANVPAFRGGVEHEPVVTAQIDLQEYAQRADIKAALTSAVHAIFDANFMTYYVGTQDGVIKFSEDLTILNGMSEDHLDLVVEKIVKEAMSQVRQ